MPSPNAGMKTSPAGIGLIKEFESCRLECYRDVRGIPTIGYGHTGAGVMIGQRISQARADQLLAADLLTVELDVIRLAAVPLTQGQFDALVSFAYNAGPGNLAESTLLRKLNEGDAAGAALQFLRWDHAGKETLEGLARRRRAEMSLFAAPAARADDRAA